MKNKLLTLFTVLFFSQAEAQDFNKYLAEARTSYSAKKLDDARFAMQQLLQELDILAGKDILKLLPTKFDVLEVNAASDNITGNSGFAGVMINREYGAGEKTAEIQIIGNSPLLGSINALLSLPFINAAGNQKSIKLNGYKGLLQKNTDTETNKVSYEIQVPLNSSLLTIRSNGFSEDELQKIASKLPISEIAKLL